MICASSGFDLRMGALCQRRAMRVQLTCMLGFLRLHARVKYQQREDKQQDERDRLLATLRKTSHVLAAFMHLRKAFLHICMSSLLFHKVGVYLLFIYMSLKCEVMGSLLAYKHNPVMCRNVYNVL